MRTGSCAVQQGLTAEAASIVKQAVTLAKRRGHAQVTPLHVANTMLAVTNGLLRTACLQSHSHPLQCKALELCFNVALNRLPASTTSSSMLGPTHHHHPHQFPSISNALVAAFKRAQAHQRRGSIENQQQPLLAVKIELEQLVISILDDPSVSRVMREAGFSSTQVKSNVEQAVSLEICNSHNNNNTPSSVTSKSSKENDNNSPKSLVLDPIREEDIASVIDNLENRNRRSTVIVGECVASLEGVVRGAMDRVDKGEVGESLRGVKFLSLSLSAFGHASRVEVENKIEGIRSLAKTTTCNSSKGYILYLGDLKRLFEYKARSYYCPVDHMIMEIGKLVCENGRLFWVMGIATFQAYMRSCKNGQYPSLDTVWGSLHPITIPAGSLRLSLISGSGIQNGQSTSKKADNGTSWLLLDGGKDDQKQTACDSYPTNSSLPTWLQQCKNESNNRVIISNDQNYAPVAGDLCKRWNSVCSSIQKQPYPSEKTLTIYSTVSRSSSNLHHHFWVSESGIKPTELTLRMYIPESNSTSSSDDVMEVEEYVSKFKELNSQNLKTLCNALESKVPWQKHIIPEIASTILQCRSGLLRRKGQPMRSSSQAKQETWLFFQGVDMEAKEKIAKELARLVFGSESDLTSIALSSFSTEDCRNKRSRDEQSCSYIERFADAVSVNSHRVFLVEDIEQSDYFSQVGFKRAIERGKVTGSNGEEIGLSDAIIILSCESFNSRSRACSPSFKQKTREVSDQEEKDDNVIATLDLNISIDDKCNEDRSVDDIGLLESVDGRIIFKIQE